MSQNRQKYAKKGWKTSNNDVEWYVTFFLAHLCLGKIKQILTQAADARSLTESKHIM